MGERRVTVYYFISFFVILGSQFSSANINSEGSIMRLKKLSPETGYLVVSSIGSGMTHLMGPYLTLWLKTIGLSFTQIGFLQSISSLITFLTDFPTGGFADKYGRRLNYSVGVFLFGLSIVIISVSQEFPLMVIAFGLAGFGSALMSGTLIPWLYDSLKGEKTTFHKTLGKMKSLNGITGAFAGFLAGFLSGYAINLPLLVAGVCGIVASVVALVFLEENYGHGSEKSYWDTLVEGLRYVRNERSIHYFIISGFLVSFSGRSFFMFWMVLVKQMGLTNEWVGYIYPLLILSTAVGGVISFKLSERTDYKILLLISTLLMGILVVMMSIVDNIILLILIIVLFEIVLAIRGPAMVTFRNELIPSPIRSTVSSTLNTIGSAFVMFVNILIGIMADNFGLEVTYTISGLLVLLSILPLFIIIKRL